MIRIFPALLTIALFSGCFRVEEEQLLLEIPQLKAPECAQVIQQILGDVQGVKTVKPDIAKQQLIVNFDSVTIATKNIEYVLSGAGFTLTGVDALVNEDARKGLPEACR